MKVLKSDLWLIMMLAFTLVLPLLAGLYFQNYSDARFISLPLHATMESIGSVIAFVLATIVFLIHRSSLKITHFHRAAIALIAMGVFDLFHALMPPGEQFVWLHSLAIFIGGILFSLVWLFDIKTKRSTYYGLPLLVLVFSVGIVLWSFSYPESVPKMLNVQKEFTDTANMLNIIGGVMYIFASFYFIKQYLVDNSLNNLLFAGHTMLFGSAGVLFFFSALWDPTWWFWHSLRLIAYVISLYYMLRLFVSSQQDLELSNKKIQENNEVITENNKMLQEYKNAIYQGSIISTSDLEGNITYVNQELLDISGYTQQELIGQPHSIFRDPETPKSEFKKMWFTIKHKEVYKGLLKNRAKDGSSYYVKITVMPILNARDEVIEYIALREDVTALVNSQKELKSNFYTDPLTKLSNRFKLNEDLKYLESPHLALININQFKSVNDFYGIEFGDLIIQELSDKILAYLCMYDFDLYRNHGDEFAIVSHEKVKFQHFESTLVELVREVDQTKFKIGDVEIDLELSLGLVESSNNLVKADLALKEAKQSHRSWVKYDPNLGIEQIYQKNVYWSKQIKQALEEDRVEIMLQPIFDNFSKQINKYEALVRLIKRDGEVVSPAEFLEVAKRTRLYGQMTRRVIQKALTALSKVNRQVSINICAEDIFDEDTKRFLLNLLRESNNSEKVILELVESEGIENFSVVKQFIDEVKSYGVQIAIDDFGTGYSNFNYLLKLEANYIKIDGSLISKIDTDDSSYGLIETIVSFAKKNHMQVVAEYVSSEQIQKKVEVLGIECSQGFHIGRPSFLNDLEKD